MRILVLGGDGYLGWPTASHLYSHIVRNRPSPRIQGQA
jgi:nucleoside-diphosphate-sugar epimerase